MMYATHGICTVKPFLVTLGEGYRAIKNGLEGWSNPTDLYISTSGSSDFWGLWIQGLFFRVTLIISLSMCIKVLVATELISNQKQRIIASLEKGC